MGYYLHPLYGRLSLGAGDGSRAIHKVFVYVLRVTHVLRNFPFLWYWCERICVCLCVWWVRCKNYLILLFRDAIVIYSQPESADWFPSTNRRPHLRLSEAGGRETVPPGGWAGSFGCTLLAMTRSARRSRALIEANVCDSVWDMN